MDQSKKTMRHFYCRDVLWETFEQMANDFDCSIDYLINEAMRYYARSKNYQSPSSSSSHVPQQPAKEPVAAAAPAPVAPRTATRPPTPPPPPPAAVEPAAASADRHPTGSGAARRPPSLPPRPTSRPTLSPPAPRVTAEAPATAPPLFLVFNNQRYSIDKEQFIIGRGSKTSDLPIKDGNISRKHAAVIRRNGMYYIKDLGSTNGIDYKGMRIDNKRIDEGDVFHLCDYELRFTYRG
jgi:FHA domain-containing protein